MRSGISADETCYHCVYLKNRGQRFIILDPIRSPNFTGHSHFRRFVTVALGSEALDTIRCDRRTASTTWQQRGDTRYRRSGPSSLSCRSAVLIPRRGVFNPVHKSRLFLLKFLLLQISWLPRDPIVLCELNSAGDYYSGTRLSIPHFVNSVPGQQIYQTIRHGPALHRSCRVWC